MYVLVEYSQASHLGQIVSGETECKVREEGPRQHDKGCLAGMASSGQGAYESREVVYGWT